ncbi:hypothetical protein [Noviherbaspirillum galbum]|uniref:Uncharacterized protein n=1 Tax=Noviherbaspirillum galbum TaxID=2709383 RepID=A0A6B3SYE3_9BURK|nr:hypothetical protein [Noviherbaspirillum galbum]NEX64386.1 hypothetical protein [Noviherbaspirillum galbum]
MAREYMTVTGMWDRKFFLQTESGKEISVQADEMGPELSGALEQRLAAANLNKDQSAAQPVKLLVESETDEAGNYTSLTVVGM